MNVKVSSCDIISNILETIPYKGKIINGVYVGARHVLFEMDDYDERTVHFAHSLREMIELLAKHHVDGLDIEYSVVRHNRGKCVVENAKKFRNRQKTIHNNDMEQYEEKINKMYRELSDYAHHCDVLNQNQAEEILDEFEYNILKLFNDTQTLP